MSERIEITKAMMEAGSAAISPYLVGVSRIGSKELAVACFRAMEAARIEQEAKAGTDDDQS